MAKVRFMKPGEVSKKNRKYIIRSRIWKYVSIIEGLALAYLLYLKLTTL